jgi:hypothetical protein
VGELSHTGNRRLDEYRGLKPKGDEDHEAKISAIDFFTGLFLDVYCDIIGK